MRALCYFVLKLPGAEPHPTTAVSMGYICADEFKKIIPNIRNSLLLFRLSQKEHNRAYHYNYRIYKNRVDM